MHSVEQSPLAQELPHRHLRRAWKFVFVAHPEALLFARQTLQPESALQACSLQSPLMHFSQPAVIETPLVPPLPAVPPLAVVPPDDVVPPEPLVPPEPGTNGGSLAEGPRGVMAQIPD